MIIKSRPAKLNLPLVSHPAPVYSKPGTGSENYNRNKLPSGLESVKISIPAGYTVSSRIPPEAGAKAQSLLGARGPNNLPFNYGESFFIEENGKVEEYLALITLHFDNHPKRFLQLPNGRRKQHPPFWHPGVSIFKKLESPASDELEKKDVIKQKAKHLEDEEEEEEDYDKELGIKELERIFDQSSSKGKDDILKLNSLNHSNLGKIVDAVEYFSCMVIDL